MDGDVAGMVCEALCYGAVELLRQRCAADPGGGAGVEVW